MDRESLNESAVVDADAVTDASTAKKKKKLNAAAIKASKVGDVLWDEVVRGLHLRHLSAKRKSFYLFFRVKGTKKPRKPKIGDWGVLTLDQARESARKMLADVAGGKDPIVEREQVSLAPTMAELWMETWKNVLQTWGTAHAQKTLWHRSIEPRIGTTKVAAVDYSILSVMHTDISKRGALAPGNPDKKNNRGSKPRGKGAPIDANRALSLVSIMLNEAERIKWRPLKSNPVCLIGKNPEREVERYTSPEEARGLMAKVDTYRERSPSNWAFLKLLIYTGARPSEIGRARWTDLTVETHPDGMRTGVIVLVKHKTAKKTKEPRRIYLSPEAMEVVDALPRTNGTIVGIKSPKRVYGIIKAELEQELGVEVSDLRLYDAGRHSFASTAISAGYSLPEVGAFLGHRSPKTTKRYTHLQKDHAHQRIAQLGAVLAARAAPVDEPEQQKTAPA